ncbi:glycosyltransferase family 2 protein [Mycobacterium sp. AMU20-3851]|uniref:glycosyltransferase family 2 protein n=1 Tax=Mycobacterium sp. AMU20-3851 TaxID=3122055 RepID=UPI0037541449
MLAFITSLRHPDNARDYARNERLLKDTLNSIALQTSNDYVVVVVSNVPLSFSVPDRVVSVVVDFPPPAPAGTHASYQAVVWDKGTKLGIGLIAAREYAPDYVMITDADDFVHRDLVAFTREHAGEPGWYIARGWRYSGKRNVYRSLRAFHLQCGTSYILPFAAYGVPDDVSVGIGQGAVFDIFGDLLATILGSHMRVRQWANRHGYRLAPLPFRGAVHHVDTGENHSGGTLGGIARTATREMRETYGMPPRPVAASIRPQWVLGTPLALVGSGYDYLQRKVDALVADDSPRFDLTAYRAHVGQ